MRTILIDADRIGDSIAAFPALYGLASVEPIRLWLRCSAVRPLWAGPPVEMLTEDPGDGERFKITEPDRIFVRSGLHMIQGWYWYLGLQVPHQWPLPPLAASGAADQADVFISPFCISHGNGWKLWDFGKWNRVIDALLGAGMSVTIGGAFAGGGDHRFWGRRPVRELDTLPLREIVTHMRTARCVITLDNGMGHLAQLLGVPHVHMISAHPYTCPQSWVANTRPNARVVFELFRTLQPERVLSAAFDILAQVNPEEFRSDLYLRANPDLVAVGVKDPWKHFIEFGIREGRPIR